MISKIITFCCFLQIISSLFFIENPDFIYFLVYLVGCVGFFMLCICLLNFKIKRIKKYYIVIGFFIFQLLFILSERYLHKISCIIYVLANEKEIRYQIVNKMELDKEYIYLKNPSLGVVELDDAELVAYLRKKGYLMVLKDKTSTIHFRFETKKFRIIALNYCPDSCQNCIMSNEKLITNWHCQIIY